MKKQTARCKKHNSEVVQFQFSEKPRFSLKEDSFRNCLVAERIAENCYFHRNDLLIRQGIARTSCQRKSNKKQHYLSWRQSTNEVKQITQISHSCSCSYTNSDTLWASSAPFLFTSYFRLRFIKSLNSMLENKGMYPFLWIVNRINPLILQLIEYYRRCSSTVCNSTEVKDVEYAGETTGL